MKNYKPCSCKINDLNVMFCTKLNYYCSEIPLDFKKIIRQSIRLLLSEPEIYSWDWAVKLNVNVWSKYNSILPVFGYFCSEAVMASFELFFHVISLRRTFWLIRKHCWRLKSWSSLPPRCPFWKHLISADGSQIYDVVCTAVEALIFLLCHAHFLLSAW